MTLKVRERHRKLKEKAVNYKGGHCEVCSYNKSLNAMEFHHRDPSQKDFGIGQNTHSWEKLKPELDKCQLLCANCHREIHEALWAEHLEQLRTEVRKQIPIRESSGKETRKCQECGSDFECYARLAKRFCTQSCKSKAQLGGEWPSNEQLRELVTVYGITAIARKLSIGPKSVRLHLRKNNIHWQRHSRKGT